MSATVGDPGDLARRLGSRPIEKIPIAQKHTEVTSGRRLVIMNRTNDEKKIPDRMAVALLAAVRRQPKSLWLCNSESEATKVREAVKAWLAANGMPGHPL